ncbi:MAG: hypothetical protein NVS1B4_26150 [Gemmatimonadaceae bacterium]
MSRLSKAALALVSLFAVVNLGGAIFAAAAREGRHTAIHVALLLAGVYGVWRLAPARYANLIWHRAR